MQPQVRGQIVQLQKNDTGYNKRQSHSAARYQVDGAFMVFLKVLSQKAVADNPQGGQCRNQPEIIKHWSEEAGIDSSALCDALNAIRVKGRYMPHKSHSLRSWWEAAMNRS